MFLLLLFIEIAVSVSYYNDVIFKRTLRLFWSKNCSSISRIIFTRLCRLWMKFDILYGPGTDLHGKKWNFGCTTKTSNFYD